MPFYLDESVVTMIAKKNVGDILEVVKAEPHPPGFYLFLKLFPLHDFKATRLYLIILSYSLVVVAISFAYVNRIYYKYNLRLWFGLIVSSSFLPLLTTHVRHDAVTFPVMVIYYTVLLAVVHEKGVIKRHVLYLIVMLTFVLFIAYIPFIYMFVSLCFVAFILRKRYIWYLLFFPGLCGLLLFCTYTKTQFLINRSRFVWVGAHENSIMSGVKNQILGKSISNSIITDAILLGFFVIFLYSFKVLSQNISIRNKNLLAITGVFLVLATYISHGFVTERYGLALYFYMIFIISYGMVFKQIVNKYVTQFIVVLYLVSLSSFLYRYIQTYQYFNSLKDAVEQISHEGELGLLFEDPVAPFLFKQQFMHDNNQVIPVSGYYPQYFKNKTEIEKKDLMIGFEPDWQIQYQRLTVDNVKQMLSENELDRYIYVYEFWSTIQPHYDKDRIILNTLNKACNLEELYDEKEMDIIIFYFNNCVWT